MTVGMTSPSVPPQSCLDTMFLPELTRGAVAELCAKTARTFLDESAGWGRTQLAMWLLGAYASLTHYSTMGGAADPSLPHPITLLDELDEETIERTMADARASLERTLERMDSRTGAAGFALVVCSRGFVARFVDANGAVGWLPTNYAQHLGDRVLSLFVAAYLSRSEDSTSRRTFRAVRRVGPADRTVEDDDDTVVALKSLVPPRQSEAA